MNPKLGELVKTWRIGVSTVNINEKKKQYGNRTIGEMIHSILPHLTNLSHLGVLPPQISNLFYQRHSHPAPLANLVHLDLTFDSTAHLSQILRLSPRLSHLSLHTPLKAANDLPRIVLELPLSKTSQKVQLNHLELTGDFGTSEFMHFISSVAPKTLILSGYKTVAGVAAVYNPATVKTLKITSEKGDEYFLPIGLRLARFTQLTELELGGSLFVEGSMVTLFKKELPNLEIIRFGHGYDLEIDDVLDLAEHWSGRLKEFGFSNFAYGDGFTSKCSRQGARAVIEELERGGIEVTGTMEEALDYNRADDHDDDDEDDDYDSEGERGYDDY